METGFGLLEDEPLAGGDLSAVAAYSAEAAAKAGSAKADDSGRDDAARVSNNKTATQPAKMLSDFGDYRLLEEIGRGGQGVVYRARQKSLNRTVALKVIGLGPWTTEAHLKRFRREAQAAASLEHPGIVPIYEVGEHEGSSYFSMKFLEGGQLDEIIRRESISIRQAVELIAKVGRTVHYAHEHGILHRDIKPGNILLDGKGNPLLTDFGLARLIETDSTITRTLEVIGTPSYMAPEQAAGEHARVSKTTDVYGLGAVLYQLLTGHPPFAGGTSYQTIRLLLDTEPRQPRLWNPKIDRDLSTICLKCLEKDPHRRYSSALALAEDLERWLRHEPIQAKRTGFFTRSRKWVQRKPTIAALIASFVALAAVIAWNLWKTELISNPTTKGIAILPFQNLTGDPENAYFADGVQDEILTRLVKIAELKVISRTSTQQYQRKPRNLRDIAKQLGVANIVEGSVQKAADQMRVNVQLVNAQTDSHLWAETYDRKLTDIFGVESEIAKRIAESLQAKLTGREEQALAVKPTNNPEAYDFYLRGLAFDGRGPYSFNLLGKAIIFYERAVQLDPNFAIAWARLSRAHAHLYFAGDDTTPARRDAAKHALENAQKLQPNSPETLLALGFYQYWGLYDYGAAKATFGRAHKILPGSSEVPRALGYVARREGYWDESITYFQEALTLDPRNVQLVSDFAETYTILRQFSAALKLQDRALDIMPNDPGVMAEKADIYHAQANLQEAAKCLSAINWQTASAFAFGTKINQLQFERNYAEAIRLLQDRLTQFRYGNKDDKAYDQVTLALMQRLAGDTAAANATAQQAGDTLEHLYRDQPDNWKSAVILSQAYAAAGHKDSAIETANRAIMLLPRSKDPLKGPTIEENLARIQATFGENSRAISTLSRLLKTPYVKLFLYSSTPITPALLRLDPLWDPLRADRAFQKLCEEKQP